MPRTSKSSRSARIGKVPVKTTTGYLVNVAGVSFANDDGSHRQRIISLCKPGERIKLVREPDNKFDPGAIKVIRANRQQLGYVPAHVARAGDSSGLAQKLDAGARYQCRIIEIIGGILGGLYGVTIEIVVEDQSRAGSEKRRLKPKANRTA